METRPAERQTMNTLKRIASIFGVLFLGSLYVFIYWNTRLFDQANQIENKQKRIQLLERSNKFCPLNDLVFYELGKAYFDLGLENLTNQKNGERYFQKSVQGFERSLMINPTSPYAHFYLGQSLLQLELYTAQRDERFYDEFKKATRLAGEDPRIPMEAGRLFLSRWPQLSEADRKFTVDVLRRIMARRDRGEILLLMNIWAMNVGDYSVMDKLLPVDAQVYRLYAQFLGEKSLSLAERQKFLAQAEQIEFETAKREQQLGEASLFGSRPREALLNFQSSLRLLQGIRFYQTLCGQNLIGAEEYTELLKSVWLNLARCRIEEGAGLNEIEGDLRQYLALEEEPKEVSALEAYLRNRGLLLENLADTSADLEQVAFELFLDFKQSRYGEIIDLGRRMSKSFVMVPEDKKKAYVRVLQIVGDAYQKTDYLYDAGDIYLKALELDPKDLATLLRIRRNYERLNEDRKIRDISTAIEKTLTARDIESSARSIQKGEMLARSLILDQAEIALDLLFAMDEKTSPLVAIIFNGNVVWEEFLTKESVSLRLKAKVGENSLQIRPLNRPVIIRKLGWRRDDENNNFQILRSMK
jgi:tetratricopeptide (TPR) repeat protein